MHKELDHYEPDAATQRAMRALFSDTPADRSLLRSYVQAFDRSRLLPLPLSGGWFEVAQAYKDFVSFIGWLAVVEAPDEFELPLQKLAALFGMNEEGSVAVLATYVSWAIGDDLLLITRLDTTGMPAAYKFPINKFQVLKEQL